MPSPAMSAHDLRAAIDSAWSSYLSKPPSLLPQLMRGICVATMCLRLHMDGYGWVIMTKIDPILGGGGVGGGGILLTIKDKSHRYRYPHTHPSSSATGMVHLAAGSPIVSERSETFFLFLVARHRLSAQRAAVR